MNWPGEKVLTRLLDLLASGIGEVARPWQIRRVEAANAESRTRERLLLEQAEQDIAEIRAGRKRVDSSGKLITRRTKRPLLLEGPKATKVVSEGDSTPVLQDFAEVARDAALAQDMQRGVNLKRVALFAEEEAEELDRQAGETRPSETPPKRVDADWFAKWRSGAQDVSREEMQRLWAKLLAGEVSNPGAYSLHTVDFLSRMSSADASLLARVAPFVTVSGIVRLNDDFFASKGIRFYEFIYLEDIGIINGTGGMFQSTLDVSEQDGRNISILVCNKTALVFDFGEPPMSLPKLPFKVFTTTGIGRELLSLASFPADEDYLKLIADQGIGHGAHVVQRGMLHPNGRQILGLHTIATKEAAPQE